MPHCMEVGRERVSEGVSGSPHISPSSTVPPSVSDNSTECPRLPAQMATVLVYCTGRFGDRTFASYMQNHEVLGYEDLDLIQLEMGALVQILRRFED